MPKEVAKAQPKPVMASPSRMDKSFSRLRPLACNTSPTDALSPKATAKPGTLDSQFPSAMAKGISMVMVSAITSLPNT